MSDLESKLAEARERYGGDVDFEIIRRSRKQGFDDCAVIAREVVAEKDAEIARLKVALGSTLKVAEVEAENIRLASLLGYEHDCDNGFMCCEGCEHLGHRHPETDESLPERHAAFLGYALPICGAPKQRPKENATSGDRND